MVPLYVGVRATYHVAGGQSAADGASPSGKATDFDSVIRRFDPSRPSQSDARRSAGSGPPKDADRGFDILPALHGG